MIATKSAIITIQDEVNAVVSGLWPGDSKELWEYYGIFIKGYFFNPLVKLGRWDGKVRFFSEGGKTYINLLPEIIPVLKAKGYKLKLVDNRRYFNIDVPEITDSYLSAWNDPDGNPYILGEHQVNAINAVNANHGGIILAGTGAGKAQPLYSKILTPYGWTTMGEIKVGDIVLTPDNTHSNVIGIYPQGKKPNYRISFNDGTSVDSAEDHLWECVLPEKINFTIPTKKRYVMQTFIKTTKELIHIFNMYKDFGISKNINIPLISSIEYNIKNDLTIDPYILGCLLGDGSMVNNLSITTMDQQIVNSFESYVKQFNLQLKKYTKLNNKSATYHITKGRNTAISNYLRDQLTQLKMWGTRSYNKFIPTLYKQSTINDRLKLIQGLMDTDGYVSKNGKIQYTSTSKQLINDMCDILRSLGCLVSIKEKNPSYIVNGIKKYGRKSYTISISYLNNLQLFTLDRKKNRSPIKIQKHPQVTKKIVNIEYIGDLECKCILIDHPKHLYITDGFTVTHNTIIASSLIKLYEQTHKMRIIIIVPSKDLVTQTCEELKQFDIDIGMYDGDHKEINKQHLVSTWQSLQNNQKIIGLYDGIIVDECHGVKATIIKDLLNGPGANAKIRFGLTGTLPKEECDAMNVRMSLGNVVYAIPAIDLINSGWLAFLKLKMYQLTEDVTEQWIKYQETHPKEAAKLTYKKFKDQYFPDYSAEKAYLKTKESRNKFIAHLIMQAREIRGNCFVIVDTVPFGKKLAKLIPNSYFIYAKDDSDVRKEIYSLFKERDDMVVIATAGLVSTGLNIKRIFNLFLIDQSKSFIRIIQSIGRGLRKASDKDTVHVYDIFGDFKYAKRHSNDRKKYYKEQSYDYDIKVVDYEKIDI